MESRYSREFRWHAPPEQARGSIPYTTHTWPNDTRRLSTWVSRFWNPGQSIETYVLLDQMNRAIVSELNYGGHSVSSKLRVEVEVDELPA